MHELTQRLVRDITSLSAISFFSFFVHSLRCTLNLLTQVDNNLYKYLRLAERPVGKIGVPGIFSENLQNHIICLKSLSHQYIFYTNLVYQPAYVQQFLSINEFV